MKKFLLILGLLAFVTVSAQAQDGSEGSADTLVSIGLWISYILTIGCLLAAIILPLVQSASDPASLMKSGIALVGLLVVFGIAYAVSGNEVTSVYETFGIDAGTSKFIGATLITTYILFFAAIAAIIYGEVTKLAK